MVNQIILLILIGLCAGAISGLVGIGGGVIIVPILIFFFGFTQHQAQGTTLALLVPPIGFLAAHTYFKEGFVDIRVALLICIGFFIGGLIGSKFAINMPKEILQKVFATAIIFVGMYMLMKK